MLKFSLWTFLPFPRADLVGERSTRSRPSIGVHLARRTPPARKRSSKIRSNAALSCPTSAAIHASLSEISSDFSGDQSALVTATDPRSSIPLQASCRSQHLRIHTHLTVGLRRLTYLFSGLPKASPLEQRVRPELLVESSCIEILSNRLRPGLRQKNQGQR